MFDLVSPFPPAGDQPQAIAKLADALASGIRHQVLLGVTGSGKTFTIANVIQQINRPTLASTSSLSDFSSLQGSLLTTTL